VSSPSDEPASASDVSFPSVSESVLAASSEPPNPTAAQRRTPPPDSENLKPVTYFQTGTTCVLVVLFC